MAGAPGRWLCRGCRLGGALLLSFSGRSSLSLPLSRPSALSPASPGRRWLCCLAGWGIASAGGGWVSLCPHAGLGCCAGFLGCRRWPLSSPCLAPSPSPGCCLWALVLLSPSALSPGCWRSSVVLWCWPAMRWGWVLALGGVGAGLSRPWRWRLAGAGVCRSGRLSVRHVVQIKPCRFGYYSSEKR